ncbi:MAG: hypothetical protein PVG98_03630 [Chromatiales bacterium]|jgi:hypothetical protein
MEPTIPEAARLKNLAEFTRRNMAHAEDALDIIERRILSAEPDNQADAVVQLMIIRDLIERRDGESRRAAHRALGRVIARLAGQAGVDLARYGGEYYASGTAD